MIEPDKNCSSDVRYQLLKLKIQNELSLNQILQDEEKRQEIKEANELQKG